jgi:hypothetical protein
MSFNSGLIHSCSVSRKTYSSTLDDNGQPTVSETVTSYRCRFYQKKIFRPSGTLLSSDLKHIVIPYSIMLPANADIQKDDKITTTTIGYAGTYSVFDNGLNSGSSSIHHRKADIVRVDP